MTTHSILTILTFIGMGIFIYVFLRRLEDQERRDRERQKDAAAK